MPPPVHGASMMGEYIHDSKVINEAFDCHYLNLTLAKDINDIGKGGIRKLIVYLTYIIHSGFISGYQNRYGDNLKPPTNVYHRMTA